MKVISVSNNNYNSRSNFSSSATKTLRRVINETVKPSLEVQTVHFGPKGWKYANDVTFVTQHGPLKDAVEISSKKIPKLLPGFPVRIANGAKAYIYQNGVVITVAKNGECMSLSRDAQTQKAFLKTLQEIFPRMKDAQCLAFWGYNGNRKSPWGNKQDPYITLLNCFCNFEDKRLVVVHTNGKKIKLDG